MFINGALSLSIQRPFRLLLRDGDATICERAIPNNKHEIFVRLHNFDDSIRAIHRTEGSSFAFISIWDFVTIWVMKLCIWGASLFVYHYIVWSIVISYHYVICKWRFRHKFKITIPQSRASERKTIMKWSISCSCSCTRIENAKIMKHFFPRPSVLIRLSPGIPSLIRFPGIYYLFSFKNVLLLLCSKSFSFGKVLCNKWLQVTFVVMLQHSHLYFINFNCFICLNKK